MAMKFSGLKDFLVPGEMARVANELGCAKSSIDPGRTLALSVLAGAFIGLGAIFSTVVTTDSSLPFGLTRILGGITFSLGLILVVVGGAELFTGNSLMIMAWASKNIKGASLVRNWMLVYIGNMAGALLMAFLVFVSGHYMMGNGATGRHILEIASSKCELSFSQALALGILCNTLVCLAIWMSFSTRSIQGKVLAIVFPITAFVAAGFEHSVANMYFIPVGLLVKGMAGHDFWILAGTYPMQYESLSWRNFMVSNLLPVSIGNIIGGSVFIGLLYWYIYLDPAKIKPIHIINPNNHERPGNRA
jgi:formate transporter